MGYLTTITIYNDDLEEVIKDPKELAKKVKEACLGVQAFDGKFYTNLNGGTLILQRPRHSDDKTLYIHAGNTVLDVYRVTSQHNIEESITIMEYHIQRLKELQNNFK